VVSNALSVTVGKPVPLIFSERIYGAESGSNGSIAPGEVLTHMALVWDALCRRAHPHRRVPSPPISRARAFYSMEGGAVIYTSARR